MTDLSVLVTEVYTEVADPVDKQMAVAVCGCQDNLAGDGAAAAANEQKLH